MHAELADLAHRWGTRVVRTMALADIQGEDTSAAALTQLLSEAGVDVLRVTASAETGEDARQVAQFVTDYTSTKQALPLVVTVRGDLGLVVAAQAITAGVAGVDLGPTPIVEDEAGTVTDASALAHLWRNVREKGLRPAEG